MELNLKHPKPNENYDCNVFCDNYTKIENAFNELERRISESGPTARISEVTLDAKYWVSENTEGSLHSQLALIDGVTEYSQVDLTPSVEQLAVFYEKDITFVTENDGGLVTVYAIGQKPQNDYTIQVTITEVDYE